MIINRKRYKGSVNLRKNCLFVSINPIFLSSFPFRSGCFHGFLVESPNSVFDVIQFGFQVVAAFLFL